MGKRLFLLAILPVFLLTGCKKVADEIRENFKGGARQERQGFVEPSSQTPDEVAYPEDGTRGSLQSGEEGKQIPCSHTEEDLIEPARLQDKDPYSVNELIESRKIITVDPGTSVIYRDHNDLELYRVRIAGGPHEGALVWVWKGFFKPQAEDTGANAYRFADKTNWTVEASSTDPSYVDSSTQRTLSYLPGYLIDGTLENAWSEGVDGSGVGQWVLIRFPGPRTITKIGLVPGYAKTHPKYGDLFPLNNRVREARFSLSDGYAMQHTFTDDPQMQEVELERPVMTDFVQITILSVYPSRPVRPGAKRWEDTMISEVDVWGTSE